MLCPRCQAVCTQGTWRSRVRREGREVWFEAACWKCPACRTNYGPLQFITAELEDQNEALAATAWRNTFSEEIPPPLPMVRIRRLMRTAEGRAAVARAFGRVLEQKIEEAKP